MIFVDETTRVGSWPKFKSIRGPYLLESAWRDRYGSVPSWCRFPIIGNLGGDGGRLSLPFDLLCLNKRTRERKRRKREKIKGCSHNCLEDCKLPISMCSLDPYEIKLHIPFLYTRASIL